MSGDLSTHIAGCGCMACTGQASSATENGGYIVTSQDLAVAGSTEGYIRSLLGNNAQLWGINGQFATSFGNAITLRYTFEDVSWGNPFNYSGEQAFNTARTQAALQGMQEWSNVANVTFIQGNASNANIAFRTYDLPAGVAGETATWAYSNGTIAQAEVTMDISENNYAPGQYSYMAVMHEIGHALGLKHPGNYNAGGGGADAPYLTDFGLTDSRDFSIMSYFSGEYTGNTASGNPITPMLFDIAAIQFLYGANHNFRAGNDVYMLNSASGIFTRWDGAGNDTLNSTAYGGGVTLDLREGGNFVTHVGNSHSWNAFGSNIENAISGAGNDTLIGNALANLLDSGNGNDTLTGGAGDDLLKGGYGFDTYFFSRTDNGHDTVIDPDNGQFALDNIYLGTGTGASFVSQDVYSLYLNGFGYTLQLHDTVLRLSSNTSGLVIDILDYYNGKLGVYLGINAKVGGAGNDTLTGTSAANTLIGGDGNDRLNGGTNGADQLWGGTGDDTLRTAGADSYLYGEYGNDVLAATGVRSRLFGGEGDDVLTSSGAASLLDGGTGDDTLNSRQASGSAASTLLGGEGNDTLNASVATIAQLLYGGAGNDTLTGGTKNDLLNGGQGNDYLAGGAGVDSYELVNGDGVDLILDSDRQGTITLNGYACAGSAAFLSAGSYTLLVGNFTCLLSFYDTMLSVSYGDGDRLEISNYFNGMFGITLGAGAVMGNAAANVMPGTSGNDTLIGGAGNDRLGGTLGGADALWGGAGADTLTATGAHSQLYGEDGNDRLTTDGADSLLDGGAGADTISANGEGSSILGGAGNDTITLGANATDSIAHGGAGNDIFVLNAADAVIYGDDGNDRFTLNAGATGNTIYGSAGNDTFILNAEHFIVSGDDGADVFTFNAEAAHGTAFGGVSNDTFTLYGSDITVYGRAGNDTVTLKAGANGNVIYGEEGNDTINAFATTAGNTLNGGDGNDVLTGGSAIDMLLGGDGDDILTGGGGADTIDAGSGMDRILGGAGGDTIILGADGVRDNVRYANLAEGAARGTVTDYDTISGFESGIDRIEFGPSIKSAWDDVSTPNRLFKFAVDATVNFNSAEAWLGTGFSDASFLEQGWGDFLTSLNGHGVIAGAGRDGLLVAEGAHSTAVFAYRETSGINHIAADELTLLAVVDGLLGTNDFGFYA